MSDIDSPSEVAMRELDLLLARWAAAHRLTGHEIADIRANALASIGNEQTAFDLDWFWKLMRPVTALLEEAGDAAMPESSGRALRRWLFPFEDEPGALAPYLQLV